jgi:multidrug efflux system membrane fusion protein
MTTNTSTNLSTEPTEQGLGSNPDQKPRKRGLIWVLILLIISGVAGYAVWRAGQPATPAPGAAGGRGGGGGRGRGSLGPTPVSVAKAHKSNVPVYLNGLGNVTAFYTVTVRSRVDGQLMSIAYKEGETVKQGQVLAEIDPRPFEVQLQQAQGTLARDTATLTNAKLDLDRYTALLAQDAIPKQQLDTQRATVAQLEGNIKTDEANINNARLQLTYAKITAPISGTIGLRLVDPGNIVRAGDAGGLLVITQLQPISTLFTIPEDALPQVMARIRKGVRLPVDAFNRDNSKKIASGYLLTVDNQIDASTGTSRLKAVFENKDNALFPNQFINVRLLVDTQNDQIVVPTTAVQSGQRGPFVYVVGEDSKVQLRQVEPGAVDGDNTVIKKGVTLEDSLVVDGIDRLQNGSQVRVRKPGEDQFGGAGGGRGRGGRGRGAGAGAAAGGGAPAGDAAPGAGAEGGRGDGAGGGRAGGRGRGRRGGGEGGGKTQ